MKKQSPRAKFVAEVDLKRLAGYAWDAMMLASSHDPDHTKQLEKLEALIYAEVKLQDRRFSDTCTRLSTLEVYNSPKYRLTKGKK